MIRVESKGVESVLLLLYTTAQIHKGGQSYFIVNFNFTEKQIDGG